MKSPNVEEVINMIKESGITAYEIAKNTPLSEVGINKILNGSSKNPRKSTLLVLYDYITNKKGLLSEPNNDNEYLSNKNGNQFTELSNGKFKIITKKIPVKAFGSYISDYQDLDFYDSLDEVSFTVDHLARGKYLCFEVQGDSMNGGGIDDTPEGAEMLCRELGRQHWKDGFRPSQYGWVIVHKKTILFKDIKEFDKETGNIVCSSRSGLPNHTDFTINLNDVMQIFKVIKRTF